MRLADVGSKRTPAYMCNILTTTTTMAKYYMEEVFSLKNGGYDFAPFEYEYESLGAIFLYWLECGNETAAQMQETYRECKEYILEDLYHLCELRTFYKFIRIFNFGKK